MGPENPSNFIPQYHQTTPGQATLNRPTPDLQSKFTFDPRNCPFFEHSQPPLLYNYPSIPQFFGSQNSNQVPQFIRHPQQRRVSSPRPPNLNQQNIPGIDRPNVEAAGCSGLKFPVSGSSQTSSPYSNRNSSSPHTSFQQICKSLNMIQLPQNYSPAPQQQQKIQIPQSPSRNHEITPASNEPIEYAETAGYSCAECPSYFETKRGFNDHYRSEHMTRKPCPEVNNNPPVLQAQCHFCDELFETPEERTKHINNVHLRVDWL
jgi:hypothetical protein